MKRRLYLLFPDTRCARVAADDLVWHGIGKRHIHAIARAGVALDGVPVATLRQQRDLLHHLERLWWNINLVLFFGAGLGLVLALLQDAPLWAWFMAALMVATLVLGVLETNLPDVGIAALRDALRHGEVLLLVDVPEQRVAEIENYIRGRHPEVALGGVSWTIERFGM